VVIHHRSVHFLQIFSHETNPPSLIVSQKVLIRRQGKKFQIQGAQILRNEAYL
jgi:hypothetical protein